MKRRISMLLLAVVFVFVSCNILQEPGDKTGSLHITVNSQLSKTLLPDLDMEYASLSLTIQGPNGELIEETLTDTGETIIEDLRHGTWIISIDAYNAEGTLIGTGAAEAVVHSGETTVVDIRIVPLDGDGELSLAVNWNTADVEEPVINAELIDADGIVTSLDFNIVGGNASVEATLATGYYSLSVGLYDGDFLTIGRMEIVRILAGQTTSGSFDFTELKIDGGIIDINIDVALDNPLHPVISGAQDVIGTDEPLIMTAGIVENLPGVSYVWFVDGKSVAQGDSYLFQSADSGIYRIDLAVFSNDGSRAGSIGTDVYVSDQVQSYMAISEIQGASHSSPYAGQTVEDVLGVVTAVQEKGFWMQSISGDGDMATSEGIYVYTYTTHSSQVGDLVLVDGEVQEYGYDDELKLTELNFVTVETLQSGFPLPDPVVIGLSGILPPSSIICNDASGDVYNSLFDPEEDGIDFFESLEGMLVEISNPVAVGPTKYGEIPVIPEGISYTQITPRGGLYLSVQNANPQLINIDTDAEILGLDPVPADIGDYYNAPVRGIVNYSYGKFIVSPTELPQIVRTNQVRETTELTSGDTDLTVATFNVENFPRSDDAMTEIEIDAKVADIAETIVSGLGSPDILGLEEVMDDSYSAKDGTVTAAANAARLINAISAAGGPVYEYLEVEPEDLAEGGWSGANIRVGFLYNPARVGFTTVGNAGTFDETDVIDNGGTPALTLNPARFSQDSFSGSRKSLIAQFDFMGEAVFVIVNHFNSKSGDQALFGENQPPFLGSEAERLTQAEAVRDMVNSILAIDASANVIVLGDLNDFQFSAPFAVLEESGIVSLTKTLLPENEQYSYIYNGNSQQLDHILASPALLNGAQVDIVHRYSEFNADSRATDHDPVLAAFSFDTAPAGTLIFSEYGEGSSYNKYVEVYNTSGSDMDLDGYQIILCNNGGTDPTSTAALTGILPAGEVYVIAHPQADAGILAEADLTHMVTNFNGDDFVGLVAPDGTMLDCIGQLGYDPGSYWVVNSSMPGSTQNDTLVRESGVTVGDTIPDDPWDGPDWMATGNDNWDSLGSH